MATDSAISADDIELGKDVTLWEVMRAALQAKECRPGVSVLPRVLVLRYREIVAEVYQSYEEPRTVLIRTVAGVRKIALNWYGVLRMLYRASFLTLVKMEGTTVILSGERTDAAGQTTLYAMKWTARQFLQPLAHGAKFPETNDSISQSFCLENQKLRWTSEANTALQFSL